MSELTPDPCVLCRVPSVDHYCAICQRVVFISAVQDILRDLVTLDTPVQFRPKVGEVVTAVQQLREDAMREEAWQQPK